MEMGQVHQVPTFDEHLATRTKPSDGNCESQIEQIVAISHELRTPLTSIIESLSLLECGVLGELSEEVASIIRVAARNSQRLAASLEVLLAQKSTMNEFSTSLPGGGFPGFDS